MATKAIHGAGPFSIDVCKALDIEPYQVRDIEICIHHDEAVTVRTTQYVTPAQGAEVLQVLKKHNLYAREANEEKATP